MHKYIQYIFYFRLKYLVIILICFVPCLSLYSQIPEEIFDKANKNYQNKEYDKAVFLYDSLIKSGYKSANLYFNLGNSYYKLNNFPAAILDYEKAKLIAGDRADIINNLNLANLNVVDKIEPLPEIFIFNWWSNFINYFSSRNWAMISLLFLLISFVSICIFLFISNIKTRKISFIIFIALFILTIFTTLFAYKRNKFETGHKFAIVFAPNVYVKSAPDEESTDQFIIHEGLKVQLIEKVGDWQQIKLADGKVGWLKKEVIKVI